MAELCARFEVILSDAEGKRKNGVIYVKSRWFATKFSLRVTDGLNAWFGDVLEEEVSRKAQAWDCTVAEYLKSAETYLGVQDPTSNYSFDEAGEARKLSWTLVRGEVPLKAVWRVEKSPNPQEITCDVLDFLMRGSSQLSEELQRKRRSFEQMKAEKDLCLTQSRTFRDEKIRFEEEIFKKFVAVLNSKKNKLRGLKEQLLKSEGSGKKNGAETETESEDQFDDDSDKEDDEEDDDASKEDTIMGNVEKDADADASSGATEILPADSPTADISTLDPGPSQSPNHDLEQKEGILKAPEDQTSAFQQPTEAITDAAKLLSGSTYTSAPRKRRHQ